LSLTVYISFIGDFAGDLIDSDLWDSEKVTWLREADVGNFAVRVDDTEIVPDDATYAAETAASIAGIPAALNNRGITVGDTRWIMRDHEAYPPTWYYTNGGTGGNHVPWAGAGYDTALNAATYKAKTQPAIEALYDAMAAHAPSASFGEHLITQRLTRPQGESAAPYDESVLPWAGAGNDMIWLGTKIAAKNGRLFGWLYVIANIGVNGQTVPKLTAWVTKSVAGYRSEATRLGLNPDNNVYYTWFTLANGDRPTQETLETIKAALEATGHPIKWVAAMGAANTDDQPDEVDDAANINLYLLNVVIPALGGEDEIAGTGWNRTNGVWNLA